MPLTFLEHSSLNYFPVALADLLKSLVAKHNQTYLLFPTYAHVKQAQITLAEHNLGQGVEACTPTQLISNLWNRYTDGRRIASFSAVETIALEGLEGKACSQGYVTLVAQIASQASMYLNDTKDKNLSPEQAEAVTYATSVVQNLSQKGFITISEASHVLWDRFDAMNPVVCSGFQQMNSDVLTLFKKIIEKTNLYMVMPHGNGPAYQASFEIQEALAKVCPTFSRETIAQDCIVRASKLTELHAAFSKEEAPNLGASEAVSIIEPLGPTAEPEAIARYLEMLSQNGCETCLVVHANPEEMWNKLSPKLAARGIKVRASWSKPLERVKSIVLFLRFLTCFTQIILDDEPVWDSFSQTTPTSPQDYKNELLAFAGLPREWWPPKPFIDFLHSSLCELPPKWVDDFDAVIRNNRASAVGTMSKENIHVLLRQLCAKNDATKNLLTNLENLNLAGALEALMATALKNHAGQDVLAIKKMYAALIEVQEVLDTHDPVQKFLIEQHVLSLLLSKIAVPSSYERGSFAGDSRMLVEIVSPAEAITRAPQSVEACILCEQTMDSASHTTKRSAKIYLLEKLGLKEIISKPAQHSAEDAQLTALPTAKLVLEKPVHDSEGANTEASPLFAKVASVYEEKAFLAMREETAEQFGIGEDLISTNYRLDGHRAKEVDEIQIENTLVLPEEARDVAPKALGEYRKLSEKPRLSPTALEALYECPRQWFYSRSIASTDQDAVYSALAKGNLYHDVLRKAFAGEIDLNHFQASFFKWFYDALGKEPSKNEAEQAYLPHTLSEVQQVEEIASNVERLLKEQKTIFKGFTPTFFEYAIDESFMTYLGAGVKGFIDRLDIDEDGNVIIIDYKSSGKVALNKYAYRAKEVTEKRMQHPQIYTYARIVEMMKDRLLQEMPAGKRPKSLQVVGVVYVGVDRTQALYGLLDERFEQTVPANVENNLHFVPKQKLQEIFDAVEEMMKASVDTLYAGIIKAQPRRTDTCTYCAFGYACAWKRQSEEAEIERFRDYSQSAMQEETE